jgi:hypothetical protein
VPFAYFDRLSARDKAIYRQSDRVREVPLGHPELLRPFVEALETALAREDRKGVEAAAGYLCRGISEMLGVPAATVQVLAVRPSSGGGELHGLYTPASGRPASIQLWMRTARHRRVVAFRTFLRTLLHEVAHHLDYHRLNLADSFHTEGFFRRESSLFHQLLPEEKLP